MIKIWGVNDLASDDSRLYPDYIFLSFWLPLLYGFPLVDNAGSHSQTKLWRQLGLLRASMQFCPTVGAAFGFGSR